MKFLIALITLSNLAFAEDVVDVALAKFGQTKIKCVVYSHWRTTRDVCPSGIEDVRINGTPPIPMCGGIEGRVMDRFSPFWIACLNFTDGNSTQKFAIDWMMVRPEKVTSSEETLFLKELQRKPPT